MPHLEGIVLLERPSDSTIDEQGEPLDVLDLPQIYQKPSAQALLSALADLSLQPQSWDRSVKSAQKKRKVKSEGVPSYLTKVVSSSLSWIDSEDEKERIWEAASQRLSERSGRTGMGAIERSFRIPVSPAAEADHEFVEITLREPALTGDNLGLKTWASSFLLAKRLATLKDSSLPLIGPQDRILELGSGTGLVGLAAAVVFQRSVILTDLPEIVQNLEHNITTNASMLSETKSKAQSGVLDWTQPATLSLQPIDEDTDQPLHSFPLILAADPIYSSAHPALFVDAVDAQLSRGADARVVVELPLRDAYAAEREDFIARMGALGLRRVDEGEEVGYDDWSSAGRGDELDEVRCWWSVWGWDASFVES